MTKRAMNQSFTLDAAAAVEVEALMLSVLFQSDYHKDAFNRFVSKQPLKFNWEDMATNATLWRFMLCHGLRMV